MARWRSDYPELIPGVLSGWPRAGIAKPKPFPYRPMHSLAMRTHQLSSVVTSVAALLLLLAGALAGAETEKLLKDTPFEEIVAKAKAGDPKAQLYLAQGHAGSPFGGVPLNRQESHKWYIAAATNNVPEAQVYLGRYYYNQAAATKGVSPTDKTARQQAATAALSWFSKAAKQGLAEAYVELGGGFEAGTVFGKDLVEAYKWFHLAIEKANQRFAGLDSRRNSLSLRLTPAQIELAKRRALDFSEAQIQEKKPTATP